MSIFLFILAGVFVLDIAWAIAAVRLTRGLRGRIWWLALNLLFVAAQLAGLLCIIVGRARRTDMDRAMPRFVISAVLLWHLLGLGILILVVAAAVVWALTRLVWFHRSGNRKVFAYHETLARSATRTAVAPYEPSMSGVSRRQFLRMAAVTAPPVFTVLVSSIAQAQLRHFRVRRFVLAVEGLPPDLHGLTLAHVSDMHLGRLTSAAVLRRMVRTVNDLRTDLVLQTGDLINDELADLPEGLELASAMEGRFGRCLIEGNHDLIESRSEFESRARKGPVPFLLNQSLRLEVRGHPVQLLGLRWDRGGMDDRDRVIARSVRELLAQRQPDAFPILLAHHPHAFDPAAAAGIPLTLSGHTHGGQIMLTERCGFGPMIYRYWSGHYKLGRSQLIVSNGVGNWFPLRTGAPAEIVHITLRRG